MKIADRTVVAFVWSNFGPYHIDRLDAAADALAATRRVIGLEIAHSTTNYPWERTSGGNGFERITLFPECSYEETSAFQRFWALLRACKAVGAREVFLCHYQDPSIFFLAVCLRMLGARVFTMQESKFDDKPRFMFRELGKRLYHLPYHGGLAGGPRTKDYLRWLGLPEENIHLGYDTVSIDRIRRLAGAPPAPAGTPFADRHFTIVARLVPRKNIAMALTAYDEYRRLAGTTARDLHICGSGELEENLTRIVNERGLTGVKFRGFVQAPEVARTLASTLALILPSTEEQFGLVVNEALAMGLPILCSDRPGARDLLVRTAVNGYVFEPDSPGGLARLMYFLASDESEWRRLSEASQEFVPFADTRYFGDGVVRAIHSGTPLADPQRGLPQPR